MKELIIDQNPEVEVKFETYPEEVADKLRNLQNLIIETARECSNIDKMQEALKWGEPSYLVKHVSTIRIDWMAKAPDKYAMYFKCRSKLVPTFKEIYKDLLNYEKNRAILFGIDEKVSAK